MNLDYRSGHLDMEDLNSERRFDKSAAFARSQLANMLLVRALADELRPDGVAVNAAYPGVVGGTGIKRHMGVDRSITGAILSRPMLWLLTVPPSRGAATPVFLATSEDGDSGNGAATGRLFHREDR